MRADLKVSATDGFPPAGPAGADQRVDDAHVLHGILERIRRGLAVARGLRKEVPLDRVLVAHGELDGPAVGHLARRGVLDENPARPIRWRIERDLDLDASERSADHDPLTVGELHAAGADGVAGAAEVEHHRREPVDAERRAFLDQRTYSPRLVAVDHPRRVDEIAPDVEDASAAVLFLVADVARIVVEIAEVADDRSHLADLARARDVARPQPLRMRPHHK